MASLRSAFLFHLLLCRIVIIDASLPTMLLIHIFFGKQDSNFRIQSMKMKPFAVSFKSFV